MRFPLFESLPTEGLAVGAFHNGRVLLMSSHEDAVQGAEVLMTAVERALLNRALNRFVGLHRIFLLFMISNLVCPKGSKVEKVINGSVPFINFYEGGISTKKDGFYQCIALGNGPKGTPYYFLSTKPAKATAQKMEQIVKAGRGR